MASNILLPRFALKSPISSRSSKTRASNAIQPNGMNGFSNILRHKKKRTNKAHFVQSAQPIRSAHREALCVVHMNIAFMTNREEIGRRESDDPSLSAAFLIIASLAGTHCSR